MMQLVGKGDIALNAPVQQYSPDWTGPNKDRVTIRHLLTHTSGLPAFKAYDEITHDPDSLAEADVRNASSTRLPGAKMVYSDIGAYMLGRTRGEGERAQTLDAYLHDHVFQPAGMHETMYNPPASLLPRIAPTEFDPKRGGLVRGKVHDERAYYLGGVSAHAGMFSTAHDLDALRADVPERRRRSTASRFCRATRSPSFTTRQVQDRALGWQKPDGNNSAGHLMSAERVRTHRLHRHVDLDGSGPRHFHHSAQQSRESDARQLRRSAAFAFSWPTR